MQDDELNKFRTSLAHSSKWNLGYFVAGLLLWIAIFMIGKFFPIETAKWLWIAATFFVLPIAVGFSKLIGADPFSNANPLGKLVGYTHMSVVSLSLPIIVLAAVYAPDMQLLVMAILYCVDFYVMTWAFGARLFAVHAAIRTVLVTSAWLAFPEERLVFIPVITSVMYAITIALIPILRRRKLRVP